MPRAVRFEDHDLTSPEELASPHHNYKENPKGILLQSGTFEKKARRNSRLTEKRARRHSTPVKIVRQMQNLVTNQSDYDNDDASSARPSRRRSMPAVNLPPQPSSWYTSPLDSLKDIHAGQLVGAVPRPPLRINTNLQPDNSTSVTPAAVPLGDTHAQYYGSDSQPGYINPSPWLNGGQAHSIVGDSTYGAAGYTPGTHLSSFPQARYSPPEQKTRPTLSDVTVYRPLLQPRILWNITESFSSSAFSSRSKLQPADLDRPATFPALDKITIKLSHSQLQEPARSFTQDWGSIKIRGSHLVKHEGDTIGIVTIRDVLNALFGYFRVPLTDGEFSSIPASFVPTVADAQRKRLGLKSYQPLGNPLRVDMLGEYTKFEGIRITEVKERRLVFGVDLGPW